MKKLILLLWILLFHTACETGTRYDTNSSTTEDQERTMDDIPYEDDPTHSLTYYEDQGEDDYAEEISLVNSQPEEVQPSEVEEEYPSQHFTGGTISDGLEITAIRVGRHDNFIRVALDSKGSNKVGNYSIDYDSNKNLITVILNGYRKFSAKFPTFSKSSIIEKIYFAKYLDDSSYTFHIKLRDVTKVKVMALESPARLVIDVQKP